MSNKNSAAKHNSAIMQSIYKFYNLQKYTDVLFEFPYSDYSFTAHRLILAAASPYLNELFDNIAEPDCTSFKITNIDSDTFEQLVIVCYNGKADIAAGNAERMLRGAVLLRLDVVIDECVDYMMAHIKDFLLRKLIAVEAEIKCEKLEKRLLQYAVEHFKVVSKDGDLLHITVEQWHFIIEKVNKTIVSQADLFWAIKEWYAHDIRERRSRIRDVIGALQISDFDTEFILKEIATIPGCGQLAMEAITKRESLITCLAIQNWGDDWLGNKDILRFDPAKEEWLKVARLEVKRYLFSTAYHDGNLYFIGGRSVYGVSKDCTSYNIRNKQISVRAQMHEQRNVVCVAVWRQYIYAFGGKDRNGKPLSSVERYDTSTRGWEYRASMLAPRASANLAILNDEFYLVGGRNESKTVSSVDCYNPSTNKWRSCSAMSAAREGLALASHQGFIYAIGGNPKDLLSVERYDPKRDVWTKIASLNVTRRFICAVSIGDQLWSFGGIVGPAKMDDTVEVYDMPNNKWLIKKNLPVTGVFSSLHLPTNLAESF